MSTYLTRGVVFCATLSMTWAVGTLAADARRVVVDRGSASPKGIGVGRWISVHDAGRVVDTGTRFQWSEVTLNGLSLDLFSAFDLRWWPDGRATENDEGIVVFALDDLSPPFETLEITFDAR